MRLLSMWGYGKGCKEDECKDLGGEGEDTPFFPFNFHASITLKECTWPFAQEQQKRM